MSSRLRNARNSSRYSSPAVVPERSAEPTAAEISGVSSGGQTSLDQYWTEPPVRDGIPSFQDQGFERMGVLEHMAPLGALPTQKTLQKLKIHGPRLSFRATTGTPVPQSEETMTPATELEIDRIEMPSPVDTEMHTDTPAAISSPERGRPRKQENGQNAMHYVVDLSTPSPIKLTFPQSSEPSPQSAISRIPAPEDVAFQLDKAISRAEQDGTRKLIPGLQKLREEVMFQPHLPALLDAVYRGSSTKKQFRTFKKYIKTGVRQYNGAPAPESTSTSLPQSSNQVPAASPRHSLAQPGAFSNASRATSLQMSQALPSNFSPNLRQLPSPLSHRLSSLKKPSHSPAPSPDITNENLVIDPALRSQPAPSPGKIRLGRSGSASSSSSLSSIQSVDERWRPAELPPLTNDERNARPVRSSGSRQAAKQKMRPSSTLPPSSEHPFTQFNSVSKFTAKKPKKSRPEESEVDREAIEQRRHQLRDQSYHDDYALENEESHVRPEMHVHPSSTATFSSLRIPPPVVHAHPLESSLAKPSHAHRLSSPTLDGPISNGTSRKRHYHEIDNDDAGLQTPRSSSPALLIPPPPGVAASRAATPRAAKAAPPPSLKARKSARVMVS
jgi:hypothetical protein